MAFDAQAVPCEGTKWRLVSTNPFSLRAISNDQVLLLVRVRKAMARLGSKRSIL